MLDQCLTKSGNLCGLDLGASNFPHSHALLIYMITHYILFAIADFSSCNTQYMTHKTENIYSDNFKEKSDDFCVVCFIQRTNLSLYLTYVEMLD